MKLNLKKRDSVVSTAGPEAGDYSEYTENAALISDIVYQVLRECQTAFNTRQDFDIDLTITTKLLKRKI